jgi:hypothetical protein
LADQIGADTTGIRELMTMARMRTAIRSAAPLLVFGSFVCGLPGAMAQSLLQDNMPSRGAEVWTAQSRSVFDGDWAAEVPPQGRCPPSRIRLHVQGNWLTGAVANPVGVFPIAGSLGADGRGTIKIVEMDGTIRFGANGFVADYFNVCGPRHAVGARIGPTSSHPNRHSQPTT